jgi:hypothetical protein
MCMWHVACALLYPILLRPLSVSNLKAILNTISLQEKLNALVVATKNHHAV